MEQTELRKAKLFIQAAEICYQHGHYDSAASRCYYAVYRAAITALQANGYLRRSWNHGTLQRMFNEKLIEGKKEYPSQFEVYLRTCYEQRVIADYREDSVTKKTLEEVLSYASEFVEKVQEVLNSG